VQCEIVAFKRLIAYSAFVRSKVMMTFEMGKQTLLRIKDPTTIMHRTDHLTKFADHRNQKFHELEQLNWSIEVRNIVTAGIKATDIIVGHVIGQVMAKQRCEVWEVGEAHFAEISS